MRQRGLVGPLDTFAATPHLATNGGRRIGMQFLASIPAVAAQFTFAAFRPAAGRICQPTFLHFRNTTGGAVGPVGLYLLPDPGAVTMPDTTMIDVSGVPYAAGVLSTIRSRLAFGTLAGLNLAAVVAALNATKLDLPVITTVANNANSGQLLLGSGNIWLPPGMMMAAIVETANQALTNVFAWANEYPNVPATAA